MNGNKRTNVYTINHFESFKAMLSTKVKATDKKIVKSKNEICLALIDYDDCSECRYYFNRETGEFLCIMHARDDWEYW